MQCIITGELQWTVKNALHILVYEHSHLSKLSLKKASEYDKEIPQSHTADQPKSPEEEPKNTDCHKTSGRQLKQSMIIVRLDGRKVLINKIRTKHRTPKNNGSNNKQ